MNTDRTRRAAQIAGLRELATWLEAHPDVPLPPSIDVNDYVYRFDVDNDDVRGDAEVARVAGSMGVRATYSHTAGSESRATVTFAGGVTYSYVYLHKRRVDAYAAGRTYLDSVQSERA